MSPKIVVGMMGSSVAKGSSLLSTKEGTRKFLDVVKSHGVKELDTARVYNSGRSEELLGEVEAFKEFQVSTKAPGFSSGSLQFDKILQNSALSHAALKQDKCDIFYIHGPDFETPLDEQCRAFGKLYADGRFARFGVSNLSPDQVEEIHTICKREGYPLPTVYQGGYNPVQRGSEKLLFPTLRKLGMSFYAYSPVGGGLLAKPIDELLKPAEGSRYKEMPVFGDIYLKEPLLSEVKKVNEASSGEGISILEATMRWFMHHSPLQADDGVILGASRVEQIEASLSACEKGPLPQSIVDAWEHLWKTMVDNGSGSKPSWVVKK